MQTGELALQASHICLEQSHVNRACSQFLGSACKVQLQMIFVKQATKPTVKPVVI